MNKPLAIGELIRLPGVWRWYGAYDISPDGQTAAVVWDKSGQRER